MEGKRRGEGNQSNTIMLAGLTESSTLAYSLDDMDKWKEPRKYRRNLDCIAY